LGKTLLYFRRVREKSIILGEEELLDSKIPSRKKKKPSSQAIPIQQRGYKSRGKRHVKKVPSFPDEAAFLKKRGRPNEETKKNRLLRGETKEGGKDYSL